MFYYLNVIKTYPIRILVEVKNLEDFLSRVKGELATHKTLWFCGNPEGGETWAPIKSFDFMGLVKSVLSDVHEKTRTLAVSFASSKACQR